MSKIVQTNISQFSKDLTTGALINTDTRAYQAALARKKSMQRIDELEAKVTELSVSMKTTHSNIEEIKNLLKMLTGAQNG